MFQQAAGIKLLHVPYRGGGPALTAFIGKQVDITAQAPGPITPHVQSGAARLLANWGAKRSAEYPDVPTMIELGYKDVEYYIWAGLFAPKGTPAPVITRLRDAMREVMADPQVTVGVRQGGKPAGLHGPAGVPEIRRGRRQAAHPGDQENRKAGREMKVGLFDHIEHGERPTAQLFDERLAFIQAADEAGFYCLHLAEHHQTPLNMVPVPGVFLGAVARLTKQIKMGPLVYLLPLYSPLRMIDEICMLDHLSHGRAEIGVGRGVSPFELKYNKVDPEKSREIFIDAYRCIAQGPDHRPADLQGAALRIRERADRAAARCSSRIRRSGTARRAPKARPGPARRGCISSRSAPTSSPRTNIDTFKAAFAKRGGKAAQPKPEFSGGIALGVQRHIFVDETDEKAKAWAKPAMENHLGNINWIRNKHGVTMTAARMRNVRGQNFEECVAEGTVIAGSPKTVLAEIEKQHKEIGFNYLLTYLFLGTMSAETRHALAEAVHRRGDAGGGEDVRDAHERQARTHPAGQAACPQGRRQGPLFPGHGRRGRRHPADFRRRPDAARPSTAIASARATCAPRSSRSARTSRRRWRPPAPRSPTS